MLTLTLCCCHDLPLSFDQVTPPECYSEYVVGVYQAGTTKLIRQATVKAPTTTYTDKDLEAGQKYEVRQDTEGSMHSEHCWSSSRVHCCCI